MLDWLHFRWSKIAFVALAGIGGSTWDLRMHRRVGILTLNRAKNHHFIIYWSAMMLVTALLFLVLSTMC